MSTRAAATGGSSCAMMACCRRSASRCSSAARCSLSASWSRVAASATWVWYCAETSWKAPRSATSASSTTTGSAKIRICLIAVSPGRTIRNTATAGSRRCSSDSWNRRTGARSAAITKLCSWAIGIGDAWAGIEPEQRERGIGPADGPGRELLLPAADAAEALRVAEQLGQSLRLARRPPGEEHARRRTG